MDLTLKLRVEGDKMIETSIVHSIVEYIEKIEEFSPIFSLSRGQGEDYPLLPSALRCDLDGMRIYSKADIQSFLEDFKANSSLYIENAVSYNENDWLIHAQHFGVPTCLLDFTYSHLISLMFALERAFEYSDEDENNAVVWLLNPEICNLSTIGRKNIVNLSEEQPRTIRDFEQPFVVTARKNNSRMVAQNGLFVYFQNDGVPLEKVAGCDTFLKKILVPHSYAKTMLRSLYTLGMRFSGIYPELSSISKDIILKNRVIESYKQEEKNE